VRVKFAFLGFFAVFLFLAVFSCVWAADEEKGGGQMKIASPDFRNNEFIPKKFSGEGQDVNPALIIENIPKGARSLVLIVDDPDAPVGLWTHWVLYDIPVTAAIAEDTIPGTQGLNTAGELKYHGPMPPSGTHRYFFKIFALDTKLGLPEGARREAVEKAIQGHVLDKAEIMGLYKR
jgi:Raf kinase inhibitor-like YbhB/YbcL family protein